MNIVVRLPAGSLLLHHLLYFLDDFVAESYARHSIKNYVAKYVFKSKKITRTMEALYYFHFSCQSSTINEGRRRTETLKKHFKTTSCTT